MKKILSLSILLLLSVLYHEIAEASEDINNYSTSLVYPKYQVDGVENYFDVLWTPNNSDEFEVVIQNNGNVEIEYAIKINSASLDLSGNVVYTKKGNENIIHPPFILNENVQMEKKVRVPAHSHKSVPGKINFPEEDFNGLLMGAIVVTPIDNSKQDGINNIVSYSIPIVLRGNIDDRPKSKLSYDSSIIQDIGSGNILVSNLLNKEAKLLKNTLFKIKVFDEQKREVWSNEQTLNVVPNALIQLAIPIENLKEGSYYLTINVDKDEDHWKFEDRFEIDKSIMEQKEDNIKKLDKRIIFLLMGVTIITIIVVISYKLGKKSRQ
ncbi:WxL protein peptidoglycan domain-containing protein [Bacillus thuringiensis]|uniref:WxL protein peptidoglycan domain-containing protein n=1 Tax=Bacillus thuringiensis TaxID=1428 RepID=UPI0015E15BB1|nr:DUF916 domain-containing protein [Bacillus thuringiensis]